MPRKLDRFTAWTRITDHSVRKAFEELYPVLAELFSVYDKQTTPQNVLSSLGGAFVQNLPFPFVVAANRQLYPKGINLAFGLACKISAIQMEADPDGPTATADTMFKFQNAQTSPTQTAGCTILSGTSSGQASGLNLRIGAGERLWVNAPAALNSVQNLYVIRVRVEPEPA